MTVVIIAFALLCICGYFAFRISFSEDIAQLIPKNEKSDITTKILENVEFADKITVIIDVEKNGTPETLSLLADDFLPELTSKAEQYFSSVRGKWDSDNFGQIMEYVNENLPILLDADDYDVIESKLHRDSIAAAMEKDYKSLISPSSMVTKAIVMKDPLGLSFLGLKKFRALGMADEFVVENGYILTKDRKKLLLFIEPKYSGTETEKNTVFAEKLDAIKSKLNEKFYGKASIKYFGSTLIAVANAKQIKRDITITTSISFTALLLILIFYYRRWWIPIIVFLPTVIAVVISVALLSLIKGTISAISLGIGSILIGVTIDYALHVLTHFRHNHNVGKMYEEVSKPIIMSAATTAIAFLCLLFVSSSALNDLGIFAAFMVLISAVASLVVLPHLYKPVGKNLLQKRNFIDRLGNFDFEKNRILSGVALTLSVIGIFAMGKLEFNNDLSQLNFVPTDIKVAENELLEATNLVSKSIYLVTYADNLDQALGRNAVIQDSLQKRIAQGKILGYSSIGNLLQSKDMAREKVVKWNKFWKEKSEKMQSDIVSESGKFGFKPDAFQEFYDNLSSQQTYSPKIDLKILSNFGVSDFVSTNNGFTTITTTVKVNDSQRAALVAINFQSTIAIDRQELNERFLGNLRSDLTDLLGFCFLAVILVLALFFRSLEIVAVSTIPIILTAFVVAALMWIFDLQLNIFSSIVCVLIFGHGVDFSIFMTLALQREHSGEKQNISVSRTSIVVAVITTLLGIGAMVFAKHPALHSIAAIALIGVISAVLITFVLYPRIFRFLITARHKHGLAPLRIRTFIHGTLSFFYFGTGAMLMSLFAILILPLLPLDKVRKGLFFRRGLSSLMKSVLYTNPFIVKTVRNISNEKFDKPAIVIANHSSFLDILAVGMLSPKLVFMVSDWVYNSPIFGPAVRAAGFVPASSGVENNLEKFREKIADGNSVVVFPEGTRSLTNKINRFKKGAFFLAENLQVDVVQILVHGTSEALPKGDFIIYDGPVTVEILPRIKFDGAELGKNYSDRTKNAGNAFRKEFKRLRNEIEKEDYFYQMILKSYHYKMRFIEHAVKNDLYQNGNIYHQISQNLMENSNILIVAEDYGQLAFLMEMLEPERFIVCNLPPDNLAVAEINYLQKRRNVDFIDIIPMDLNSFDEILLATKSDFMISVPELFVENHKIAGIKILKKKN